MQQRHDGGRGRRSVPLARPGRQRQCRARILSARRGHGRRRARAARRSRSRASRSRPRASTAAPSWPISSSTGSAAAASEALEQGATLIDPESVWFSADTELGRDCTIEPHVVFGPGVTIADGAMIRAFCHIEGATIAAGCEVGPFARLRPGAVLGEGAKVGNFVEVKKATSRRGRQGQPSELHRRRRRRREGQHRRRHDHLQLRRLRQVSDRDRRGRVHRLEQRAGRAGDDRRGRDRRRGIGDHQGCRRPTAWRVARGEQRGIAGWAKRFRERRQRRRARNSMCGIVGIVGREAVARAAVRRAEAARISRL